jgi:hypothetical protein
LKQANKHKLGKPDKKDDSELQEKGIFLEKKQKMDLESFWISFCPTEKILKACA